MSSTSRKVLVPLATLVAAGAVAVGSGATFTSDSANTISAVTAGTLTQSNSKADQAIFELTNLKPGDTLNSTVTLTNTGSLASTFSLTENGSTNGFSGDTLSLSITDAAGTSVYNGTFGGLQDGAQQNLGVFAAGEARTYTFTVKLAQGAGNENQGKSAGAVYTWDAVQLDAETYTQ